MLACKVSDGDSLIVSYLLDHGVDVNLTDNEGKTAKDYATHPEIKKLIENEIMVLANSTTNENVKNNTEEEIQKMDIDDDSIT